MIDTDVEPIEESGVHQRLGLLVVGVLGVSVGALATLVPSHRFGESPDIVGWVVGVVVLGCGALAVARDRSRVGGWLIGAAISWHLSDLARLLPATMREGGQRAAIVHVGVLGAAILTASPRPINRLSKGAFTLAALTLMFVAVSGWTGGWRIALPLAGVAMLAAVAVVLLDSTVRRDAATGAWLGAGCVFGVELVGAALARRSLTGAAVEEWLGPVHQLSVVATSVLAAFSVSRTQTAIGVELGFDKLDRLEDVIARTMSVRKVTLAFAAAPGSPPDSWIDVTGHPIARPNEPALLVEDTATGPVALICATEPFVGVPHSVRRVLRLARDHARARFTIAQQVTELEASRRRVLAAQNAARVEVYEALCDGPLATFQEIANDLHSPAVPDAVIRASNRARMNLEELALDLNPVSARRPLATALRDVVDTCPVLVDLSMDPHLDLIDERGETIWFTVSEALANVVKHAPGATATVTVTLTDEALVVATISDDGPGEANAKGSGLQGLADRAEALGGSLRVSANLGGGTVVELRI